MAGKPLNRLELRRQSDAAEPLDPMEDESEELVDEGEEDEVQERRPKKKAKAPAKSKAKPAKPAARMRIVWTVMSDAFKPVATFEYSQKEAADARAAELTARGKGTHFVVKTKEAMPDNAPGLGAAIPRTETPPPPPKAAAKEVPEVDDEDEPEEEEEPEADVDEESDD